MLENRKRDLSDEPTKRRTKRERYTPVACNQCKLRKAKCSGHLSCRRCEKHALKCVYDRILPEEPDATPPDSNGSFGFEVSGVRASLDDLLQRIKASSQLMVINSNLCCGDSNSTPSTLLELRDTMHCISSLRNALEPSLSQPLLLRTGGEKNEKGYSEHPLSPLSRIDALEAIEGFREEVESLYPFINLVEMMSLLDLLYYSPQSQNGVDLQTIGWSDMDDSRNIDLLKLIIACAIAARGKDENNYAGRLMTEVEERDMKRMTGLDNDMKDVTIGAMLSVYYYQIDEMTLAWRKIGGVARMCLELGLHKYSNSSNCELASREAPWISKLFWGVYVLDRRYSFMTNLPFTFRDEDMDPNLPLPDNSSPYLLPMVSYGRLGAKIITSIPKLQSGSDNLDIDNCLYLGGEIERWIESTSTALPYNSSSVSSISRQQARNTNKSLATYCRIRANQMRLSLFKHALYSPGRISSYQNLAELAVQSATDNIQILRHLHIKSTNNPDLTPDMCSSFDTSPLCNMSNSQKPQVQRNFFLISSVSILYLVIRNAPSYSGTCMHDYFAALNLLRSSAESPFASRRLQDTVKTMEKATSSLIKSPILALGSYLSPSLTRDFEDPRVFTSPQKGGSLIETAGERTEDNRYKAGYIERSRPVSIWEDLDMGSFGSNMSADDLHTFDDDMGWVSTLDTFFHELDAGASEPHFDK